MDYVLLGLSQIVPCLPLDVYDRTSSVTFNSSVARPFFEHRLLDVMLTYANVQGPRQDSHTKRIPPDPKNVKKILEKDAMRPVSLFGQSFHVGVLLNSAAAEALFGELAGCGQLTVWLQQID